MSGRIEWIDSLKGLGIILVVWGHLNLPLSLETIIYSFHMPLFFFVSGYLFKANRRTLKETLSKKAKSLLIPYLFFASISFPFGLSLDKVMSEDGINPVSNVMNFFFLNGSVGWNSPLWFLVCLFLVEVVYTMIVKYSINRLIVVSFFLIIGYALSLTGLEFPFGLHIIAWGVLFYMIGHLTRELRIIEKINSTSVFVMSLVILAGLNLIFGILLNVRVSVYHNVLGNYMFFLISALAGTLLVFLLISKLPPVRLFNFFGENTLLILATHYFVIYGYRVINEFIFDSQLLERSLWISILLAVLTLALYYPASFVFNKYLPRVVGRPKKVKQINAA